MNVVWKEIYKRVDRQPDVYWVPTNLQNCGRTVNGARGFMNASGCAGSESWRDGMNLVWFGEWPLTGLAHETEHITMDRDGKPIDRSHTSEGFLPGGRVELANKRLKELQLCGP